MLQETDLKACLDAVCAIASEGGSVAFARARRCEVEDFLCRLTRAVDDARLAWGVPAAAPAPRDPLTPREREVVRWLSGGKTDRDIGDILGISPRTVHKHLQRIYEKLGVETRTAAVVRAMGVG